MTFTCIWTGHAVSENDRLKPGRKRWRASAEYTAFKNSLAWTIRSQSLGVHFTGRVEVSLHIKLRNPDMDATNIVKPAMDALELSDVIGNDNKVWRFHLDREEHEDDTGKRIFGYPVLYEGGLDEIRFEVREMEGGLDETDTG